MVKSPATHKQKILLGYMFTLFKSHLLKKRVVYLAFLELHQGKVSVSLKFHKPPLATTELGKEKKLYFLGKKLHGKKII